MATVLLVDGTNILMRAVFAARSRSRTSGHQAVQMSASGEDTAAMVIFMGMLSSIVRTVQPDRMMLAFDTDGDIWRTAYLDGYKAHRGTRDHSDVPTEQVQELLTLLGVHWRSETGFEADDLIAAAALHERHGQDLVVIYSGDKDLLQLLDDRMTIQVRPTDHGNEHWDAQRVTETFVRPSLYAAYLALAGDPGDGVPGVRGIGKIKAKALLAELSEADYPEDLVLDGRWEDLGHTRQYLACLAVTDLHQDWAAMGLEAQAQPYPIYPERTPELDDFIERYLLRSLEKDVDKGVLWRVPEVLGTDSMEEFLESDDTLPLGLDGGGGRA